VTSIDTIPPRLDKLKNVNDAALCLFNFEEKEPLRGITGLVDWRLLGKLSKLIIDDFFYGKQNETLLFLPGNRLPVQYVIVMGLGKKKDLTKQTASNALSNMIVKTEQLKARQIIMTLPGRTHDLFSPKEATLIFLSLLNDNNIDIPITLIDTNDARSVIKTEIELWKLKNSIADQCPSPQLIL
jgi:hypothetical protein